MNSSGIVRVLPATAGQRNQIVRNTVVEDRPPNDYRAIDIVPHGVLHSDFAHFTSFMCIPVGTDPEERSLQVAEGIGTDTLDL